MRTLHRVAATAAAAAACTLAAAVPAGAAPQGPGDISSGGEGPIFITVADASVVEGDEGTTNLVFPVKLNRPSDQLVKVEVATSMVLSPDAATTGVDYQPMQDTRAFAPGVTKLEVAVKVNGDLIHEPGADEVFGLRIEEATSGVVSDDFGAGRIKDDDPMPVLTVGDVAASEGTGGPTGFHFPLVLSHPSDEKVSVDLSASPGSAAQGADWQAAPASVVFEPGQTAQDYAVSVVGDSDHEGDETFTVTAANPEGLGLSDGTGAGTIEDDDPAPANPGEGQGPGSGSGSGEDAGDSGPDGNGAGGAGAGGSSGKPGTSTFVPAGGSAVAGSPIGSAQGTGPQLVPAGDGNEAATGTTRLDPAAAADDSQPSTAARAVLGLVLVAAGLALLVLLLVRSRSRRIEEDPAVELRAP